MAERDLEMQGFDRLEALIDSGETQFALSEARSLKHQIAPSSSVIAGAFDDFLVDLMTLAFVAEGFNSQLTEAVRKLARRRLSRIRMLTMN
ncbi:hypothetical protein [Mesorhizobium sp. 128a]